MITLGYKLSSEEHSPLDLVRYAQMAQDAGFGFALISDHYHPWIDKQGQSRYAEVTVCYARDESTARRVAREHWPTSAMESSLSWELPLPAHFEAVAELVTEEQVAESITCGPDPARHLAAIRKYADAGYDHICVHQVGKEQKGFFELYADAILPQLRTLRAPRGKRRGETRRRRKS